MSVYPDGSKTRARFFLTSDIGHSTHDENALGGEKPNRKKWISKCLATLLDVM